MIDFQHDQPIDDHPLTNADAETTRKPEPSAATGDAVPSRPASVRSDEHATGRRRLSRKNAIGVTVIGTCCGVALLACRSPELRRVVAEISRDAEIREASKAAYDLIAKKWVQYGGPTALAGAVLG